MNNWSRLIVITPFVSPPAGWLNLWRSTCRGGTRRSAKPHILAMQDFALWSANNRLIASFSSDRAPVPGRDGRGDEDGRRRGPERREEVEGGGTDRRPAAKPRAEGERAMLRSASRVPAG